MSSAYNNIFKVLVRKCHSLKMDDVLRLLVSLYVFEVIFRSDERLVRTAWFWMTDEVSALTHP